MRSLFHFIFITTRTHFFRFARTCQREPIRRFLISAVAVHISCIALDFLYVYMNTVLYYSYYSIMPVVSIKTAGGQGDGRRTAHIAFGAPKTTLCYYTVNIDVYYLQSVLQCDNANKT